MRFNWFHGVIGAAALGSVALGLWLPARETAWAQPVVARGENGEMLLAGAAGDLQDTRNLIYVIHKRRLTGRESKWLKKLDADYPEERITLCVYRMMPGGGKGPNGSPGRLLYMRDITWDLMLLGGDQATADEVLQNKKWLDKQLRKALEKEEKQMKKRTQPTGSR